MSETEKKDEVVLTVTQDEVEPTPELDEAELKANNPVAEKADSIASSAFVIDPTKTRVIGEEGLPKYTPLDFLKMVPSQILYLVALLAVAGYVIAALAVDFDRAEPLLYIGIFFVSVKLLSVLSKFFSSQLIALQQMVMNLSTTASRVGQVLLLGICVLIAIILTRDDLDRMYGLLGLVVIIFICWVFSWDRAAINWRPVLWGFLLQYVFAIFILRTTAGENMFDFFGEQVRALQTYTDAGVSFVFATNLAEGDFAFTVLPVIILVSGLTSVLFYMGWLQGITLAVGQIMTFTMGTSAPESLSAAGNIFLGQTESPLLVRPYLKHMTNSELHAIMTGGFSTIAGGVLVAYISFGIPADHLLSASVMSAPAALAISKIVYPESMKVDDTQINKLDLGDSYNNVIEAFSVGCTQAIGLIANIIVNLIGFLAIIALLNNWTVYFLEKIDVDDVNFQDIIGYVFTPFALMMGVERDDLSDVGKLLGTKIVANEFVAYLDLVSPDGPLTPGSKSYVIATYAIAGFSNISSIGIQLGALTMMAPSKATQLSSMAFSAMICGNIACFMTACIAGVLVEDIN